MMRRAATTLPTLTGLPVAVLAYCTALATMGCNESPSTDTSCDELQAEWDEFVESNRDCTTDGDCALVINENLDPFCYLPLGAPEGDLVAVSALPDAEPFVERWETECHATAQAEVSDAAACYFDYPYYEILGCVAGQCQGTIGPTGP